MTILLATLPEELLERIIALSVSQAISPSSEFPAPAALQPGLTRSSSAPLTTRPLSPQPQLPRTTSLRTSCIVRPKVHRFTPLLVNSLFARIGTAVLYTHIHLTSRTQCIALVRTLSARPDLAQRVKTLRIDGMWPEAHNLLGCLRIAGAKLKTFDMTICSAQRGQTGAMTSPQAIEDAQFCDALELLPTFNSVNTLVIRKTSDAYLTLPGPSRVLGCLSVAIGSWKSLRTVDIGFRLPSGPRLSSVPAVALPPATSACKQFVNAIANAPFLRVVHAQLPAAWNSSLLEIALNPSLHAIRLEPAPPVAGAHHLFLMEARKHPRLAELITAGCPPPEPVVSVRASRSPSPDTHSSLGAGRHRANTTLGNSSRSAPGIVFPSTESATASPSSTRPSSPTNSVPSLQGRTGIADNLTAPRAGDDFNQGRRLSRRRSGKGHTRQSNKWARRISLV